jgi:hypothetical protein
MFYVYLAAGVNNWKPAAISKYTHPIEKGPLGPLYWGEAKGGGKNQKNRRKKYVSN